MTNDYSPVACDAYDQIEILAMRRSEVEITVKAVDGSQTVLSGRVMDTSIHDGAEYLVLQTAGGSEEIRLDHISRIFDQDNAYEWRQKIDTL